MPEVPQTEEEEAIEEEPVAFDPFRSARLVQRTSFAISLLATLAVHVGLAWMLHQQSSNTREPVARRADPPQLCGDRRCQSPEVPLPRRPIDVGPPPEFDTIEIAVIAALGHQKPMPKELPKLVKYEQRRKIQDGINIDKANEKPKELKDKRDKPKEAELDKRKKDPLDDILDAPEDDDPRKRPTDLDDIVGREDGDFHGMDLGDMKGHPALARMIGALRSEMTVSQMIPSNELRKLKTRVRIDIDYTGAIRKLSIIDSSGNKHFDTAVRQAVQRFMPASGGSRRLPIVPKPIREAINSGQIRVLIDGSRLRR